MKKYTIGVFVAILSISSFIGCGKSDDKVVAEIGGYELTTSEFNSYFSRVNLTFPTATEEFNKRREILDTMIVTRLLIQAAYEKNIDQMDEIDRLILANKDKFLLDALYQSIISKNARASDVDIQEFYNRLEFKFRASHILVKELDTATALFERIQQGENFEQLAFEYSIDPTAKRNKGDLGYFVWGSMVSEFQEAIYQMQPGELATPFKSKYGYHIVKLVDKLANENRTSFAMLKEEMKSRITQQKTMDYLENFYERLQKDYPVTIEESTFEYILHKREEMYPPQVLAGLPKNDFDLEQLDRNEKELIVGTIKDAGQMTLNEFLTQLQIVPVQMRPDFDNYDSLAIIVFELKKMDILTLEAVKLGFDSEENYLAQLKLFKELNMAGVMRNDSIVNEVVPDENMIRAYYDQNSQEFTNPAQIHVYEILLSDEMKARKFANTIRSLKEFKEKAMDLTERVGKKSESGDLNYITRSRYPEIFDLARKTGVGAIGGPVVTLGKYSIFYVVDKINPALKDYLGVKRSIFDKLTFEQRTISFEKWVNERKSNTKIEINEDALRASINMDLYVTADSLNQ